MKILSLLASLSLLFSSASCGHGDHGHDHESDAHDHDHEGGEHGHEHGEEGSDDHGVESLGTVTIGGLEVQVAQGHGAVEAGKEVHLVVKLPYSDDGETSVRAWIGTEDRTLSLVGKAEYTASEDAYNLHAMAPAPLPSETRWWIEIARPDGTKEVGSAKPIL